MQDLPRGEPSEQGAEGDSAVGGEDVDLPAVIEACDGVPVRGQAAQPQVHPLYLRVLAAAYQCRQAAQDLVGERGLVEFGAFADRVAGVEIERGQQQPAAAVRADVELGCDDGQRHPRRERGGVGEQAGRGRILGSEHGNRGCKGFGELPGPASDRKDDLVKELWFTAGAVHPGAAAGRFDGGDFGRAAQFGAVVAGLAPEPGQQGRGQRVALAGIPGRIADFWRHQHVGRQLGRPRPGDAFDRVTVVAQLGDAGLQPLFRGLVHRPFEQPAAHIPGAARLPQRHVLGHAGDVQFVVRARLLAMRVDPAVGGSGGARTGCGPLEDGDVRTGSGEGSGRAGAQHAEPDDGDTHQFSSAISVCTDGSRSTSRSVPTAFWRSSLTSCRVVMARSR